MNNKTYNPDDGLQGQIKNKDALVSIITATYNSTKTLLETYNSIKYQSFLNWEWLITDDCSTDETTQLLVNISAQDSRVKFWVNKNNSGAAISRNNSIDHASGDFLAFIDSDDLWCENKLEKQINFMMEKSISFSFTPYEIITEDGISTGQFVDLHNTNSYTYSDMLKKKATLGCSTVILERSVVNQLRMPNIRTGQDYAMWLSILKKGYSAHLYDEPLTRYRIVNSSISRNKVKKAFRQWSIYRTIEGLSIFQAMYCFCFYAFRAVFRK